MQNYIAATRFPFSSASLLPGIFAGIWCWVFEPSFNLIFLILSFVGILFLHLGANTINDYFDWDNTDKINTNVSLFNGGSRSRLSTVFTKNTFLKLAVICFLGAIIVGTGLSFLGRPYVIFIGLAGGLCGILYSVKPFSFQKRGLGELLIFLAFGPLITLGVCYVTTGTFKPEFFAIGIPNGLAVVGIIWINEFPDYLADKKTGKNNMVVKLGTKKARYGFNIIFFSFYLSIIYLYIINILPMFSLLIFITLPLVILISKDLWKYHDKPEKLLSAQGKTILFQIISCLFLISTVCIKKWF
jgi:1,4-dihydroxy-2-naphthoate polyprenyltransferase